MPSEPLAQPATFDPGALKNVGAVNPETLRAIHARLLATALRTPLIPFMGAGHGPEIRLKAENLQPTGSFKIRGAVNALHGLDGQLARHGIYTASAGNFGQGLAYAAKLRGIAVRVHVPHTAAQSKIDALRELGATVISHPFEAWWRMIQNRGLDGEPGLFIHPFADPSVILGNATIGLEIVEDWPEVETILVPFGGGGLSLGIALGAKALKPSVKVIAVESEAATPLKSAFDAGRPVKVPFDTTTFITGIGTTGVSPDIWPLLQKWLDGVRVVSVAEATKAVRLIATRHHMIAEGAGAVSLAAALAADPPSARIAVVISGGHIDAGVLGKILKSV